MKLAAFADDRGEGLVEVLVSVGIMGIILSIFLSALSTGSLGVSVVHERVTAENIARSQLEYVKETGLADHYDPTAISRPGYTAVISATTIETGLQLITVTVSHNGGPVFVIESYKVDR